MRVRARYYLYTKYKACFKGNHAGRWFVDYGHAKDEAAATALGQKLCDAGYIREAHPGSARPDDRPAATTAASETNGAAAADEHAGDDGGGVVAVPRGGSAGPGAGSSAGIDVSAGRGTLDGGPPPRAGRRGGACPGP